MIMSLLRWESKILNRVYKTDRYNRLAALQLDDPQKIDYTLFFELTPDYEKSKNEEVILSANKICRSSTSSSVMQQQVGFMNSYVSNLPENDSLEHVVIYSSLSKCRIWPKVLKSGNGFVPDLIRFYNRFTQTHNDLLDFKFDPIILSQKYTKIMEKVNNRKKDNPELIKALKENDLKKLEDIITSILSDYERKKERNEVSELTPQHFLKDQLNNIYHNGMGIAHIASQSSNLHILKELFKLGIDFEALDKQQQTPVYYAVKREDRDVLKFLVEEVKVNVNHREYQARTPFYLAAFEGNVEIVDYLYSHGADPQICSKLDRTPLSKACYLGNVPVVKYLLSIKVDLLKRDNKGRTALHNAVWGIEGGRQGKRRGHIKLEDSPESAQLIIQAGHPLEIQDYDGFTPLFSAVSSLAIRSVRLLLGYKANINHKTHKHESCCFIAAKYGHCEVLKLLIEEYNSEFTSRDIDKYTPLCASITLSTCDSFYYLSDKHVENKIKLDIFQLWRCCCQYEQVHNFKYIVEWMKTETKVEKSRKIDLICLEINEAIEIFLGKQFNQPEYPIQESLVFDEQEEDSSDWGNNMNKKANESNKVPKKWKKNETVRLQNYTFGVLLNLILEVAKSRPEIVSVQNIEIVVSRCIQLFHKKGNSADVMLIDTFIELQKIYKLNFEGMQILSHHREKDVIKLIMNLDTNLTAGLQEMKQTFFRLAKFRMTAVFISIFNNAGASSCGAGKFKREELIHIAVQKTDEISLLDYCLVNGICDIAVFLQQTIKRSQIELKLASIPQCRFSLQQLTEQQATFVVEEAEPWIFSIDQIFQKMGEEEKSKYESRVKQQLNIDPKFATSNNYIIVDDLETLKRMERSMAETVLIGIDVEHFNQTKSEYFICSIQVSLNDGVYILDPLSQAAQDPLSREQIQSTIRALLSNPNKIKIFHAYENDLKWINEDYGIDEKNCRLINVADTSRIFQFMNKKKDVNSNSIGLKTLAEKILGYEMRKDFQRADWRIRPLFKQMIQYAAIDAEILPCLYFEMIRATDKKILQEGFSNKKVFHSRGIRYKLQRINE